jgi:hypothetical protein
MGIGAALVRQPDTAGGDRLGIAQHGMDEYVSAGMVAQSNPEAVKGGIDVIAALA